MSFIMTRPGDTHLEFSICAEAAARCSVLIVFQRLSELKHDGEPFYGNMRVRRMTRSNAGLRATAQSAMQRLNGASLHVKAAKVVL